MVSFQCHACGDVVKKPKLDQHRSRCHSGYDCIDCSTTFNTPGEYKGHTSCISEAEKYQKSLYKGPKTGEPKPTAAPKPNAVEKLPEAAPPAVAPRASNAQWKPVPEKEKWGVWGNSRGTRMTGANDTPLGVNNRPDPIPKPTAAAPPTNTPVQTNGRKHVEAKATKTSDKNDKKVIDDLSLKVIEEPKNDKKSKKGKQVENTGEVDTDKAEKESKKKKEKKHKQKEMVDEVKKDKEKKEKKKEKRQEVAEANEEEIDKKGKRKRVEEDDLMTGEGITDSGEKKKKKKEKAKSSDDVMDVDLTPSYESSKKKEKKAKKEKKSSSPSNS